MAESKLTVIIERLQAMVEDNRGEMQTREFMQFGVPVCRVTYQHLNHQWVLERYEPDRLLYFDDLDLVAIEIFDCLYDFRHSF